MRRALALALVLLGAVAMPARADTPALPRPTPPAAQAPPPGAERVELRVNFPPWQYTGTFRLEGASGTLDQGLVRDQGGFSAGDGTVERVLEGARGTLTLRLQAGGKAGTMPPVFGRWSVRAGTGAYAGLDGGGTFTSCSSGAPRGASPFEQQYLIGHVLRR
ncbi:MAG: hypothetical protein QM767_03375 [Anaeromyxobacter sp.]